MALQVHCSNVYLLSSQLFDTNGLAPADNSRCVPDIFRLEEVVIIDSRLLAILQDSDSASFHPAFHTHMYSHESITQIHASYPKWWNTCLSRLVCFEECARDVTISRTPCMRFACPAAKPKSVDDGSLKFNRAGYPNIRSKTAITIGNRARTYFDVNDGRYLWNSHLLVSPLKFCLHF